MSVSRRSLNTASLPEVPVVAPDGSSIWELLETDAASLVRCELPQGGISLCTAPGSLDTSLGHAAALSDAAWSQA